MIELYDKNEIKAALADMNMRFWKDIFDKQAMLLKVYASDEYIDRFGEHDAVDSLERIRYAQSMMHHYEEKKERWS